MWEELARSIVWTDPWLSVERREMIIGGKHLNYSVVDRPNFVLVIPVAADGVWLVRQLRVPTGDTHWEFPQGGIEDRDVSPLAAAERELREETGLRVSAIEQIGRLAEAPGFVTSKFDVFVATVSDFGERHLDESEADLTTQSFSPEAVTGMVAGGQMTDAASVAAFGLLHAIDRPLGSLASKYGP